MEDAFFRVAAIGIVIAGLGTSGYYRARAETKGGSLPPRPEGLRGPLRVILALLLWGALLAPAVAPRRVAWSLVSLPEAVRWVGLVLGLLVVPLIWWTMRSIGTNVSESISTRAGATLVTHGPYRWIRHPIYTSGLLLFVAVALMLGSWLVFAALAALLLFIPVRALREEARLVASFGDAYLAYMRRTGRFFPRLFPRT